MVLNDPLKGVQGHALNNQVSPIDAAIYGVRSFSHKNPSKIWERNRESVGGPKQGDYK